MKAVITGGSSGLGLEFARIHAQRGFDMVLIARSKDKLEQIQAQLESQYDVTVEIIVQDLTQPGAVRKICNRLKNANIEILINNAGFGYAHEFLSSNLETQLQMIDLNIRAVVELTHFFGNQFVARKKGKILNIASIAGFVPGPNQAVYYASKAFVRSFSYAVAQKLRGTGVTLSILSPGVTKTNFFTAAQAPVFSKAGDDPYAVAASGYAAMMQGRAEVVYGAANTVLVEGILRVLPTRLATLLVGKASKI